MKLDLSKLLGFRLVAEDNHAAGEAGKPLGLGARIGAKPGLKPGGK